jgi:methionyl-tRNA formyltransferase
MRLVFMGTPDFALPTLEGLARGYELVAVVTQPDRPAGRGRRVQASPVKARALSLGIPVLEPERVRAAAAVEELRALRPDLIVVAAFGQILPVAILQLPGRGCLNVHASLLPRWRGAAPVQAAILHGDPASGVTIMQMEVGLDTGPIVAQRPTPIGPEETGGELSSRLAQLGAELILEVLPDYLSGKARATPQDETQATLAPMLKKAVGRLDLTQDADRLARQVRAYEPWPGSFLDLPFGRLLVRQAHSAQPAEPDRPPGSLVTLGHVPAIHAGTGVLVLDRVQLPGGKPVSGEAYLRGSGQFVWGELAQPSSQ